MTRSLTLLSAIACTCTCMAVSVSINVTQPAVCNYATGSLVASASGGTAPYTYLWGGGESTADISGLVAGTYSVTVTDFLGAQATDNITLTAENYPVMYDFDHAYCPGQVYHAFFLPQQPGGGMFDPAYAPYTSTAGDPVVPDGAGGEGIYFFPLPGNDGQMYSITYWDVNGCPGELWGTTGHLVDWPTVAVLGVEGSCSSIGSGSVTFASTGEGHQLPVMYQLVDENMVPVITPVVTGFSGMHTFEGVWAGNYQLIVTTQITPSMIQNGECTSPDTIDVVVPDIGPSCGQITGAVYVDFDTDCEHDGSEPVVPDAVVEIQPGPIYTNTVFGQYEAQVGYGNYTITSTAAGVGQSCPAAATVDAVNEFPMADIGNVSLFPLDVGISMGSGPARPGFIVNYALSVYNWTAGSTGLTTVTMDFDPVLGYVSADPIPANVAGSTITWTSPSLEIFGSDLIQVQLQVPPNPGLIGTVLVATATVSTANADGNAANDTATLSTTVTGSVDPNDKLATTQMGVPGTYVINEDDRINYTIRFQNTGTDTAFHVVITDTLPSTLDPGTFVLGAASHPFTWSMSGPGIVRFMFPFILLPDSGANEAASHGLIQFSIRPRQPVLPGTVIENIANIYFDFNPPVITEPSVLVAEFSTGVPQPTAGREVLDLLPNPASDRLRVSLAGGSLGRMRILTLDGRVVRTMSSNGASLELDVHELRAGTYFVEVEGSATHRARFVKQ